MNERTLALGCDDAAIAVVIAGHYRPRDGQERHKSALGHGLDLDIE
ncbi:MAG: hypothetical protein M3Y07_07575 [Acidobacteriota bacterium]|nr:hypothetical protein [Acidobacteriota bacterium]